MRVSLSRHNDLMIRRVISNMHRALCVAPKSNTQRSEKKHREAEDATNCDEMSDSAMEERTEKEEVEDIYQLQINSTMYIIILCALLLSLALVL